MTAALNRQTAAIVSAVSRQEDGAAESPIYIDKMVVRDDSDIYRIAQRLYELTRRESRSRGGSL